MASVHRNQELNDLLIEVVRSLLHYTSEAWPWASAGQHKSRQTIEDLAARQQHHVAAIVDLLVSRRWIIDFGMYPAEFTDLHYVGVDYLLVLLVLNQTTMLETIEKTVDAVRDDAAASELVKRLLDDQRDIVKTLKELAQSHQDKILLA